MPDRQGPILAIPLLHPMVRDRHQAPQARGKKQLQSRGVRLSQRSPHKVPRSGLPLQMASFFGADTSGHSATPVQQGASLTNGLFACSS
ncbi:hypothetical protein GDO81_023097 [Engystomops pustulosus]|uniref:Uncharacterized protein n=1 Tax=Engystomops pustulosus TaxID=76066 RepID=A0AAV6ZE04_ENGPU|nr:hypothetical protein GDO81_023097 [Engystomops pustulosus]